MSKIVKADFDGSLMSFTAEAWFNATEAADKYGKRPVDWLNQDGTREYITMPDASDSVTAPSICSINTACGLSALS